MAPLPRRIETGIALPEPEGISHANPEEVREIGPQCFLQEEAHQDIAEAGIFGARPRGTPGARFEEPPADLPGSASQAVEGTPGGKARLVPQKIHGGEGFTPHPSDGPVEVQLPPVPGGQGQKSRAEGLGEGGEVEEGLLPGRNHLRFQARVTEGLRTQVPPDRDGV
jgi:hypothetical protein